MTERDKFIIRLLVTRSTFVKFGHIAFLCVRRNCRSSFVNKVKFFSSVPCLYM